MQFDVRTFTEFFVLAAYLLAAFALIGAAVKVALNTIGITVGRAAAAPVLGIAVVVLASWYWALPFGGTKPLPRIALAVSAVVVGLWAFVQRRSLRSRVREPHIAQSALLLLICFVGIGATTVANSTLLFERERFTVLTIGNNDAPSYALMAQHMLDEGPEDPGTIVGFDTGFRSLGFANGAYSALAEAASISGQDVWRVMQPTLFVTLVLGAYATALLLREILGYAHVVAIGLCTVAGFSVLYTTYLVAQWFYSQLLGIVVVATVTAILFRAVRSTGLRDRLGGAALVALLIAAGLSVYPHMVVMGSIALLPLSAISLESWRAFFRRAVGTAIVFGAGCAAAAALAPGLVSDAIEITRELEGVEAGWPLPAVFPTEMFGFQTSVTTGQSWVTVAMSALLLLGLGALAAFGWKRGLGSQVAPLLAGVAVIVVSYTVVYHREGGPTYRQWKWITFFIPLFVAFCLALVVATASKFFRKPEIGRRVAYAAIGGHVALCGMVFASGTAFPSRAAPTSYLSVQPDHVDLSVNPLLDKVPVLHVNVSSPPNEPYWETMWLAYFLRDKELSLAAQTYYPAATAPASHWYIERNDQPVSLGAEITPLNATYRLVRMP